MRQEFSIQKSICQSRQRADGVGKRQRLSERVSPGTAFAVNQSTRTQTYTTVSSNDSVQRRWLWIIGLRRNVDGNDDLHQLWLGW
jgi:hypothetical protein